MESFIRQGSSLWYLVGPLLDPVFEELSDDLEEILESAIQIVELVGKALYVGRSFPVASLLYLVEDPFDLPPSAGPRWRP